MKTFKRGGIHPNPNKFTAGTAIREVEASQMCVVSLAQSIGAPARCIVKPGQIVKRGEKIGEPGGFISAAVHSPVDGVVKKVEPIRDPQGLWQPGVIIERAEAQEIPTLSSYDVENFDIDTLSPQQIIEKVKDAGIVGAGGATFPTHVKLSIPPGKNVDIVMLNGAECEPYLTCDDTLMRNQPSKIILGMRLIMKAVGASRGIVGIEANKPEAIKAMKKAADGMKDITVETLKTAYPQGGEKQLIYALSHRIVPAGGLPADVGVVVDNVATAYCIAEAVAGGSPMVSRLVTITGPALTNPGNFLVNIGTPISTLIEAAGGHPEQIGKIVAGGPMMGRAVSYPDAPSSKGLSGVLVLPADMSRRGESGACVRCGKCVNACPMGLEPYLLMTYGQLELDDESKEHGVLNCLECGSCSYVCPAVRPILDYIRLSRRRIRSKKK